MRTLLLATVLAAALLGLASSGVALALEQPNPDSSTTPNGGGPSTQQEAAGKTSSGVSPDAYPGQNGPIAYDTRDSSGHEQIYVIPKAGVLPFR